MLRIVFPQPDRSFPAEAEALRAGFIVFRNQLQFSIYRMSESLCGLPLTKTQSSEPCAEGGLPEVSASEEHVVIPPAWSSAARNRCPVKHGHPASSELATGGPAGAPSRGN